MARAVSLYVRHLPDACRHEDLRRLFGRYGRIVDVTIPLDYFSGRMKGFAFVEFDDPRDARDAHESLDHSRFMGREIEVEFTRGYKKTPSEMRVKDRYDDNGRKSRSRSRKRRGSHCSRSYDRSRSITPIREKNKNRNNGYRQNRKLSDASRSNSYGSVNDYRR